ncbi:HEAT repeat domain-containing protein [Nostoc sp. CALU 546]|uniref:HEAT repeat domain-containing protein n=1 Tax=Nostoc sp. CALU 546 TaxID=1867241 RepID=UPI003B682783
MPRNSYSSPVNQLLDYQPGTGQLSPDEWPDYQELGITAEDIPELIRMATDEDLYNIPDDENDFFGEDSLLEYAPIHAVRALGQLRASSAIEPLISLFPKMDDAFDNEVLFVLAEDLTDVLSLIGLSAIPALAAYLADDSHEESWRVQAIVTIKRITAVYPEHHAQCVAVLSFQLESFEENSPELNAHIIWALTDLNAINSLPLIEQAFKAECVDDEVVGDWDDVQKRFGLSSKKSQPPKSIAPTGSHQPAQETVTKEKNEADHERQKKAQQKREARRQRNLKSNGS